MTPEIPDLGSGLHSPLDPISAGAAGHRLPLQPQGAREIGALRPPETGIP